MAKSALFRSLLRLTKNDAARGAEQKLSSPAADQNACRTLSVFLICHFWMMYILRSRRHSNR